MEERRLMAVHAHPDDESSKGAGMTAKYAQAGRVCVVTCTGGERGAILNPNLADIPEVYKKICDIRRREMKAAANCLGIEHVWLGFEDSGFPDLNAASPQKLPKGCFADLPLKEPVAKLVTQIRRFRPQVLTCYDENGGYPHPDHIRAHQTALASVAAAADPEFSPADGEPWKISKVYYDVTFSIPRMTALDGAMRACGLESNLIDWRKHEKLQRSKVSHAKINVADFFPQRDSALRAHQTQIDPDGFFFSVPRSIEAAVWPWEEFFLAQSAVGMPQYEEHDLFERIPGVAILP